MWWFLSILYTRSCLAHIGEILVPIIRPLFESIFFYVAFYPAAPKGFMVFSSSKGTGGRQSKQNSLNAFIFAIFHTGFKHVKYIYFPKDEFNDGGSALLNMCIMDPLIYQSMLELLYSLAPLLT